MDGERQYHLEAEIPPFYLADAGEAVESYPKKPAPYSLSEIVVPRFRVLPNLFSLLLKAARRIVRL